MENPLNHLAIVYLVRVGFGVAACLLPSASVIACQYTVRDIGFVDLRGPEYTIVIRGELDERIKEETAAELSWLADSNCRSMFAAGNGPGWEIALVDGQGREFRVGRSESGRSESGRPVTADRETPDAEVFAGIVRERFDSPAMTAIRDGAAETFSQILVVEGSAERDRVRAHEMARRATDAIRQLEPMLPRPLAKPVGRVTIAGGQRTAESMLLWALGLDSLPPERSAIAVVYGRGKLAGRVLTLEEGDERELLSQLALIGESCECETDRRWTEEPVLPGYWPRSFRQRAANGLGFDPDSPLVRAEVARIIGRRPGDDDRGTTRRHAEGRDAIERLLLGYDESAPETDSRSGEEGRFARGNDDTPEMQASAPTRSQLTKGVRATVVAGDGWGFGSGTDDRSSETDASIEGVVAAAEARPSGPSGSPSESPSESLRVIERGEPQTNVGQTNARQTADRPVGARPWPMIGGVLVGFVAVSVLVIFSMGRGRV